MSKLKIFIIIAIISIIVGAITASQLFSVRDVTFKPISSSFKLNRYGSDTIIADISKDQTLSLKDGYYCATANNKEYDQNKKCFTVYRENSSFDVDFDYSKDKLASLLKTEKDEIINQLSDKYKSVINYFTACEGALYKKGEWYSGVVTEKIQHQADSSDYYKFIMQKEDGKWIVKTTPSVVISKLSDETKDIPYDIIVSANNQSPCGAEVTTDPLLPDTTTFPEKPPIRDGE